MTVNGKNERVKREYVRYLRDARGQSEGSIDTDLAALARFETYTRHRDFAAFRNRQASGFKEHLAAHRSVVTRERLSDATQLHTLAALRKFFGWLSDQDGYRGRLKRSDADYFNLSRKRTAVARAARPKEGPTVEQLRHVVSSMPAASDIEKRDRALLAFAALTGARDDALASLRLKHINLAGRLVLQDARDVRTKASKTIETWFFPIDDAFERIVVEWIDYLKREKRWGLDDPLFPKTLIGSGSSRHFSAVGLKRECWRNSAPIRVIFKRAFECAGLPYFNPHSLRKTLARLGESVCASPEEFKAWSQNLGHDSVLTTFTSYGQVDRLRQRASFSA